MTEKNKEKGRVKAFLRKHSFIVIFAVAVVIAVTNYLVYPIFISRDLKLTEIPVASTQIPEGTRITSSMVTTISVNKDLLTGSLLLDESEIIGNYVKSGASVPAGSFFFSDVICSEAQRFGDMYSLLGDGEYAYPLPIDGRYDLNSTLKKDQFVDIYFNTYTSMSDPTDSSITMLDAPVFGILKEKARIVDISTDSETKYIVLALTEEDLMYFNLAEQVNDKSGGSIYPLISFASSGEIDYKSIYYDQDSLRNWLSDRSKPFTYSEVIQNKKYLDYYGKKETEDKEGEILSDGGTAD